MADSAAIAQRNRAEIAERSAAPRTEYTLRLSPDQYSSTTDAPTSKLNPGPTIKNYTIRHQSGQQGGGISGFFTNPHLITGAWMVAMATVAVDEWKRNHIFPRPSRLWWTTMTFALLGAASMSQFLAPLAGALAVGYAIAVLWQYFNGTGQFTTEASDV